ncbi:hypothetical protein [Mammaliicoccus sp. JADD-157]|uniref:hypothetical protein n=1 Tax=Mammaliicoccus sp. JADD-157 TaxID=3404818 RepID=UPI003BB77EFF
MKLKVLKITLLIVILVEEIRSVRKKKKYVIKNKSNHGIKLTLSQLGNSIENY